MTIAAGNLFSATNDNAPHETITSLLATANLRLERIVSHAYASPEGFWYDQEWAEWVVVLKGSAGLLIEGESAPRVLIEGESAPRVLKAGDFVDIPAHARHRVAWTDPAEPTVWLALHYR